ncbi:hypothetical protein pb186bvf_006856 [Paramecium bursaria]
MSQSPQLRNSREDKSTFHNEQNRQNLYFPEKQIIYQVVMREEIENPLKKEIDFLKQKIIKLTRENEDLNIQNQQLLDQLIERQKFIETNKQKFIDMENSKQQLKYELEKSDKIFKQVGTKLEFDKLRALLNQKDDEIRRLKEKYQELEEQTLLVLQEKLVVLSNEKEYWKKKYCELSQFKNRQSSPIQKFY